MKSKFIIPFALVAIILLALKFIPSGLAREITTQLENAVQNNDSVVSFSNSKGHFDSLMLIECYSNTDLIEKVTHINLEKTGIQSRDDYHLIVLLENRNVKEIIRIETRFGIEIKTFAIFPKNYLFKLKKTTLGSIITD